MEKKEAKKQKERRKWDGTLKWEKKTIKNEEILHFEINKIPFFMDKEEKDKLLCAIKEINPTAHFIITSIIE